MDWSAEAQKFDEKVAEIVRRDKSPERLKELFPTTAALLEYSKEKYPYPHRRNSVLALAVQSGDVQVLQKIMQIYFSSKEPGRDALMLMFLGGTDGCGQYFDYHYFAADLSPEDKARAMQFQSESDEDVEMWDFKIKHKLLPEDKRSPEQKEHAKIYELIKETAVQIFEKGNFEVSKELRTYARDSTGAVMEEIFDPKEKWVLLREQQLFSEISLNDNKKKLSDEAVMLKTDDQRNFAQQSFKKFFFPELYYWAREPLNKMQKMMRHHEVRKENKDLEDFFIISRGKFEIIREYEDAFQTTLRKGETYCGVCLYSPSVNESTIAIEAAKIKKMSEQELATLLAHEMTHNLDMVRVCAPESGNEQISDTEVVKFALMALFMEAEYYGKDARRIPDILHQSYKVRSYPKEFTALVMQGRAPGDCALLQNMQKFIKRCNLAKIDEDKDFLQKMPTLMKQKMPDYREVRKTYTKFVLWLRSREQYDEMVAAEKPAAYLKIQEKNIEFREKAFAKNYGLYLMREDGVRFDMRMADLINQVLEEKGTQKAFMEVSKCYGEKNR